MQTRKIVRMQRAKQKVYLFDSKVFENGEWIDTVDGKMKESLIRYMCASTSACVSFERHAVIKHNTSYYGRVFIYTAPCVCYLILQFTIFNGDHTEHNRFKREIFNGTPCGLMTSFTQFHLNYVYNTKLPFFHF